MGEIRLLHRDAATWERDYIATSWKRAVMASTWPARHNLSSAQAWAILNASVDRGVLRNARVFVGALEEDDTIVTWVAVSPDGEQLLFAHTKPRFRRLGLFKQLRATLTPAPTWRGFDPIVALEATQ